MRLPSSEIPQADRIEDVARVVEAVNEGFTTFQDIANFLGKVERQGRYYRLAAEIIGLITNARNHSELTTLGRNYINAPYNEKRTLLIEAVLTSRLFQRIISFIENKSTFVTREELSRLVTELTQETTQIVVNRRLSTIISWLQSLGLIISTDEGFILAIDAFENGVRLPIADDEPILPTMFNLREYQQAQERASATRQYTNFMRNMVLDERANNAHIRLVNLVSRKIVQTGRIPRYNHLIDLAVTNNNQSYIFEMKSLTESNVRSQIRKGISQLYEYRYIQNLPEAKLILTLENSLPTNIGWMLDYIENDRGIYLLWNGQGNELFSTNRTRNQLSFLWL